MLKQADGFTLLETLVASSLIGGVMMYGGSLAMSTIPVSKEKSELRRIGDTLTKARNMAKSKIKCVTADVQIHKIDLTAYRDCAPLANPEPTESITFSNDVTLSPFDTGNPLVFNPQGGTVVGVPSKLTVTTANGVSAEFNVLPAIGSISRR